jgi:hypothetical protein
MPRITLKITPPDFNVFWCDKTYRDFLHGVVSRYEADLGFMELDPARKILNLIIYEQFGKDYWGLGKDQISKTIGVSERTAYRAIERLRDVGYIDVLVQERPVHGFANRYTVMPLAKKLRCSWGTQRCTDKYIPTAAELDKIRQGLPIVDPPPMTPAEEEQAFKELRARLNKPKLYTAPDGSVRIKMPNSGAYGVAGLEIEVPASFMVDSTPNGTPIQQSKIGSEADDGAWDHSADYNSEDP